MRPDIYVQGQMATDVNLLETGELEIIGRLVDASNASLLCKLADETKVIYKPIAGERPLWDFDEGCLANREFAAYCLSEYLGLGLVPFTVLRDGPSTFPTNGLASSSSCILRSSPWQLV